MKSNKENDFAVSGASKFIIHPDWQPKKETFDADIAAVVLVKTITFTNFVRPICIWTQTRSYDDIINVQGVIAGNFC